MLDHLVPANIRKPFAKYSHAVEVQAGARLLFCSGQLGISLDDRIPKSAEEQAVLCFEAIGFCLIEAGMGFPDLVRISAYVTERAYMTALHGCARPLCGNAGTGLDPDDRQRLHASGVQGRSRGACGEVK
jgi:enamine deaminase RidA (YjgF/YER057c/UK114 family)